MFLKYFLMVMAFVISCSGFGNPPRSFNQAKKLAGQIFADHAATLYCKCHYENKDIDLSSCGMQAAQSIKRAHRMEWEHMLRRVGNML